MVLSERGLGFAFVVRFRRLRNMNNKVPRTIRTIAAPTDIPAMAPVERPRPGVAPPPVTLSDGKELLEEDDGEPEAETPGGLDLC